MLAALGVIALLAVTLATQAPQAIVCRGVDGGSTRLWRFERTGPRWTLVHTRDGNRAVRLTLPDSTEARVTAADFRVRSKTSNGGIDVTLTGSPRSATLDAYVSYELEVNVDASLTPAIDDISTDGPIGVRCDVSGDAG